MVSVALIMSGCAVEPGGPSIKDFVPTPLHGFEALGSDEQGVKYRLNLSGPVEVPDRDLKGFMAYALRVAAESPGAREGWVWTAFLDAELREVVRRYDCGGQVEDCERQQEWSWRARGSLPAYGIGFPNLIQTGHFFSWDAKRRVEPDWAVTSISNTALKIRFQTDKNSSVIHYTYHPARMIPESSEFTIENYRPAGPISGAQMLQEDSTYPAYRPWTGVFFSGEENDTFGVGVSHREIFLSANPRLGEDPGTCMWHYMLRPLAKASDPPPPTSPVTWNRTTAEGKIGVTVAQQAIRFDFQVGVRGGVGRATESWISIQQEGSPKNISTSCNMTREAPWPAVSLDEALAFATSLNVSGTFTMLDLSGIGILGRERAGGGHLWQFWFRPDFTNGQQFPFYRPYSIGLEPVACLPLRFAFIAPADDLGSAASPC
jgi:hypothetical protein